MLEGSRIVDVNRINLDGYYCGSRSLLPGRRKLNRRASPGGIKDSRNPADQPLIDCGLPANVGFTRFLSLPQLEVDGTRHPALIAGGHQNRGHGLVKSVMTIDMNEPWVTVIIKHHCATPGRSGM